MNEKSEVDGIIYLNVMSDGTSGSQWVEWFRNEGYILSPEAKSVLLSEDFKATSGVSTKIAVLKGALFEDGERMPTRVREKGYARSLTPPHPEVACLIRRKFSNAEIEEMGLRYIVVMHEPLKDFAGKPCLLDANISGGSCVGACYEKKVSSHCGFAFASNPQN